MNISDASRDELVDRIAELQAIAIKSTATIRDLEAALAEAREANGKMAEALEPFATYCEADVSKQWHDDNVVAAVPASTVLRVRHFRRAAEVLAHRLATKDTTYMLLIVFKRPDGSIHHVTHGNDDDDTRSLFELIKQTRNKQVIPIMELHEITLNKPIDQDPPVDLSTNTATNTK